VQAAVPNVLLAVVLQELRRFLHPEESHLERVGVP
jgi:hypothetical protein